MLARAGFDTNSDNIRIRFTAYRTHVEKHATIHATPNKITNIEATELPEEIESEITCTPDYKDAKVFHEQFNCEELGE